MDANINSSITHKSQEIETIQVSITDYIQTTDIHTEYYSAIKRKDVLIYAMAWMSLERIIISKTGHTENDKIAWFHLYEVPGNSETENRPEVSRLYWEREWKVISCGYRE